MYEMSPTTAADRLDLRYLIVSFDQIHFSPLTEVLPFGKVGVLAYLRPTGPIHNHLVIAVSVFAASFFFRRFWRHLRLVVPVKPQQP